jgi:hypothetical protein
MFWLSQTIDLIAVIWGSKHAIFLDIVFLVQLLVDGVVVASWIMQV